MNNSQHHCYKRTWKLLATCLCAAPVTLVACNAPQKSPPAPAAHNLRPITAPAGGSIADAHRASLARFVGIWQFEGWSVDSAGIQQSVSGRAAATIEREHFVLIDLQATSGQMAGRALRRGGSILLASEPGLGVTLTTWGDASPSVGRLIGRTEGSGASFVFDEAATPAGRQRVQISIHFRSDDHWIAELRDADTGDSKVLASYEFKRAAN
ncbi:MAG: hypothetical protein AMXMBFR58_02250 [Phycisphaerae bacterium]